MVLLCLRELVQQKVVCLSQAQALLGSGQLSDRRMLSVEPLGDGVPVFQVLVWSVQMPTCILLPHLCVIRGL